MEKLELNGTIDEKGIFTLHNRQRFEEWCRRYAGKSVAIRFERRGTKRSDPANRYYWGVVIKEIAIRLRDLGNDWLTDEDVHDLMKLKFNHEDVISAEGELLEVPKSTAILTKTQFSEYVDRVRMWASGFLEINIPDPGTKTELQF